MRLLTIFAILLTNSMYGMIDFDKVAPGSQDRNGNTIGPVAPWDSNGCSNGGWDGFDDCCLINDHFAMPEPSTQL